MYVHDASEPLVAPPSWLRSCCLPPRYAIRAPLVVQSLRRITHVHGGTNQRFAKWELRE
jgi:hypothetical protein